MKLSEEIRDQIWRMASDPEAVHYIEKYDGEGYKVEEIDGDYCHGCAADKARELDKEDGDDIAAAVKGASLSWTTEAETDENTVSDDDNTQTGGNGGGNTPSGELEG